MRSKTNEPLGPELFIKNRAKLAALLPEGAMAVIHSNDEMPTNADGVMGFKQNSDLYYLTGVDQAETVLLFFPLAQDEASREILFIKKTSELIAIWEGEKLSQAEAKERSGIQSVKWTDDYEQTIQQLIKQAETVYLLKNEHARSTSEVETRNDRLAKEMKETYPLHTYQRLAPFMSQLRMVKEEEEIAQVQKAVDLTESGFRRVLGFVKPGVGEWEIEAEYLHEFISHGTKGFAYTPIIGAGKNACVLHYVENKEVCQDGDLLLMDVATLHHEWNADMTRTIPVNGKFTDRQRAVYEAVLRVLRASNDILRPGILLKDYQKQVVKIMAAELEGLGLISTAEASDEENGFPAVKQYFMHGTSHHLGLDVHDVHDPNAPVAVGMVFTIEPGIYIRDENLGIRLENNVVIGEKENRDLFDNIPIEVDEIEALMAGALA